MENQERRRQKALARYKVISGYLALDPPRGQRRELREKLAQKVWTDEEGNTFHVEAATIRVWLRRYRKKGLAGLEDKERPRRGTRALTVEQSELCCTLKREVPERSLDRILKIVEEMKFIEPGVLTRSTLHRVLQRADISGRPPSPKSDTDLDRFEADFPNELWQSDMLVGPWLPDPERPGKMRRAYLYAFIDDHSRLLLHGRFSFKGDLPALELVFRRCLQRWGQCRRCYYDNGATYRAKHMKHIVGELGIHPIIYTQRYRPMGHGKIEALNRLIRSAFLAELKASPITTLDALNEAFLAWADGDYNRRTHSETGQTPLCRWRNGLDKIEYADEEKLRLAFLWHEDRTADKAGCLSLFATRYQVGTALARRRVELRYDPEVLHEIEVWHKGHFVERIKPFEVARHRRPKPKKETEAKAPAQYVPKTADWLGHLVRNRRTENFIEPSARHLVDETRAQRHAQDQGLVDLLLDRLDPSAIDVAAANAFLERHGPFDLERAEVVVERLLGQHPADQHVHFYLDAIRQALSEKEMS